MTNLDSFVDDPGAWADPVSAAPLIASGLMTETARRLLRSPRTATRASHVLAQQLGRGDPGALDPADAILLSADTARLDGIAVCVGCVWHGQRVRALISNADIAALNVRFGTRAREAALRHTHFATGSQGESNDLHADILRDGMRCIAAWINALPDWAAGRMRLKWAGDHIPDAVETRTRLVRMIAGEL